MTIKFEVGKTYQTRAIGDHELIYTIKILRRTEKTIMYDYDGDGTKISKVHVDIDDVSEFVQPEKYRNAPIFRARREVA